MQSDLAFLAKKLVFFILYALILSIVIGLLFIDVIYLQNAVKENSLTEISQESILFVISAVFLREARKNSKLRPALILISGFFACLLIRELDSIFDEIFHGAWAWIAIPLALICIFYAVRRGKDTLVGLAHFARHQSYGMMAAGILCVLVFSRLFGMGELWQGLMQEHFDRTAKNMVEEGCELLGYCLCLISTFWYLPDAIKLRK
ncbi:hypothetical protein [Photorhabdus heterorhabditis]|uniref:Uncharacterized protein n=1 Tax=Photorhabdus heterorhabditis TaxID=880156 RepID=A0A5B0WK49_9GAMM|nr:hypothetical protein [Photorhabdus heterorhabditis]KAA1186788.1 hypothetical protein F0L16_13315 [Photorhabdus heterorhabditis]KOY63349.1 hypothetical protein AM629_03250 [Photorhabdus heterorhabditis]MBS9443736.1 hypothetical protein [Photorhabdus heterorhabditis]